MSVDLGAMYRGARIRIGEMVSDDVGHLPVAATPDWDVHDVMAHLTGIVDDALSGNMEGVTTDPWTAAQVARGRGRSVSEMVACWHERAPMVEAVLSSPDGERSALAVIDIHTHECDLLAALGLPVSVPDDVLVWIGELFQHGFASASSDAGLAPISVDVSDLELFRSRLGRRTVDEVRAYAWSSDPEPYLDQGFIFGRAARSLGEVAAG